MFKEKFAEKFADQLVTIILGAIGFAANAGVWSGVLGTGLYHQGWWKDHSAWIPLFVVVLIFATVLTVARWGYVIVCLATVVVAIAFPWLYKNPDFLTDNWPFRVWLLHGVGLALGTAFIVGSVERLYRRWFGPKKPS